MELNYIILAHKNPQQLKRLIARLDDMECFFYVHIDKDVDIRPFLTEVPLKDNIIYVEENKRQASRWGGIEVVEATIHIIRKIIAKGRTGYCILLSGQDYPLKNNSYIRSFFSSQYGTEFMNCFSLPSDRWADKGAKRLNNYKFDFSKSRGDFILYPTVFQQEFYTFENAKNLLKLIRHRKIALMMHLFLKRKFPRPLRPYGGSQWWAVTTESAGKIVDYLNDKPGYLNYHKYTLLPDEIFFQSVLMHVHAHSTEKIHETITYVNWQRQNVPLPVTFTKQDFPELNILPDTILFARKFDAEADTVILDMIDMSLEE